MAKYFRIIYWDKEGRRCTSFVEAEQKATGWGAHIPDDHRKVQMTNVRIEYVGFFDEADMQPLFRQNDKDA